MTFNFWSSCLHIPSRYKQAPKSVLCGPRDQTLHQMSYPTQQLAPPLPSSQFQNSLIFKEFSEFSVMKDTAHIEATMF